VSAGWRRQHELVDNTLRFTVDGAWGVTHGVRDRVFFYGLAGAGLRSSAGFLDEHEWSSLAKLGVLWNVYADSKLKLEIENREYEGSNVSDGHISSLQFNHPLRSNMAFRVEYQDFSLSPANFTQTRVDWHWYF
jgi:hypothetical protein